jgi:glycosyltransferase involved in cell wall biosynthesis
MRKLSVSQTSRTDGGAKTIQVIIPAYNEAETIGTVLEELPSSLFGYDVVPLVVSDGSADGTAREAKEEGSMVVEHAINQGQGGALKTGFEIAERNGASIVVTMDADGQHPPDELEQLVAPIVNDEADFVMGSRYKGTNRSGNGAVRHAGVRTFTWLINRLTKSDITDCTNGFRAIRGSDLSKMTLTEERFNAPELIIEAKKNGLRIREIPITVDERESGESKKPQLGYALGLTRAILVTWIR